MKILNTLNEVIPLCFYIFTLLLYIAISTTIIEYNMRVILKVMSNHFLHANWEQQMKESTVVDGTSCCVILECPVTSVACIM